MRANRRNFGYGSQIPHCADVTGTEKMLVVILTLLQKVWNAGQIPEQWNTVEVVSIFKSGDTPDLRNYRGISLISITLKRLCSIIQTRLHVALEERFRKSRLVFALNAVRSNK
eukprot:Pompholyxophrys_punicea_v1_NODE_95_length_3532_cov_6.599080.p4 type:complete len:113 gc:universal NODE_95_length_3532_cov_6.599080:2532-2870(+)